MREKEENLVKAEPALTLTWLRNYAMIPLSKEKEKK